jgi:EAL domain-containing protein (putative c-di-GMP-specific phosphodiesterase class I)
MFHRPPSTPPVLQRLRQQHRLRAAVHERQFELHYQPMVDLRTRSICGLEALIRWQHPLHGLTPPADFVGCLEAGGLIVPVGRWALEQAAADIRGWRAQKISVPRVALNLSAVQMRAADFLGRFLETLGAAGGYEAGIDVEVTEALLARDGDENIRKLQALRRAGVQIYVDDFGSGASSLSQIVKLPIDALKIDRSFVAGMNVDPQAAVMVCAIIGLARALGCSVVAEGIETESQAGRLLATGCEVGQGFLFSPAVAARDVPGLLTCPLSAAPADALPDDAAGAGPVLLRFPAQRRRGGAP